MQGLQRHLRSREGRRDQYEVFAAVVVAEEEEEEKFLYLIPISLSFHFSFFSSFASDEAQSHCVKIHVFSHLWLSTIRQIHFTTS